MANSPGVYTQEKDLTFNIQSITSNATGYIGMFRWGPADQIVEITTNESELATKFGQPDSATSPFFHAALNYMLYSTPLLLVRTVGASAKNSINESAVVAAQLIKNDEIYDNAVLTGISFIGRYPGDLGNSLKISLADSTGWATWEYSSYFTYAPDSSTFNMVVVDEDGLISGIAGSVLESYELMSLTSGTKKTDGTSAYLPEVLKAQSNYVLVGDTASIDFNVSGSVGIYTQSMIDGVDDNVVANGEFDSVVSLFSNSDEIEILRMFTSFNPTTTVIAAIDLCDSRGDCVAFNSCQLSDVYNAVDRTTNIIEYFGTTINKPSSYAFNVDNWKLVHDKYNDKDIWIPCDSDAAGLHARLFVTSEPWFSPAGFNRGQLKNVIKLAWNSNSEYRYSLYKNSINSVVAFKNEGTVLFGDKTALMAPSAFSRINVRTLFIVLKKSIARAAKYQLFELNDYITQTIFKNSTDRYLDNVKSRRGIYDKDVVCDSSNNTGQVIDNNEFVADIYIKPAKSINYIKLNFIAVATSVAFTEVEGAR